MLDQIFRFLGRGNDKEKVPPSQLKIICVQATGGVVAAAVASCTTTPLDTIKTRLQVAIFTLTVRSGFYYFK